MNAPQTKEKPKTLSIVAFERGAKLDKRLSDIFDQKVTEITDSMKLALRDLFEGDVSSTLNFKLFSIPFPGDGTGHKHISRLDIDQKTVEEIESAVCSFKSSIKKAAEKMFMTADAQPWPVEKLERALDALEMDAVLHASEVCGIFYGFGYKPEIDTYEEILAAASTMRGAVVKAVDDMGRHLEIVAREASEVPEQLELRK